MTSATFNSQPLFQFKYNIVEPSATEIDQAIEATDIPKASQQKLACRWVPTGKSHPKMELQWVLMDSTDS